MEIWKYITIEGYENSYQISTLGRVKNKVGRILKPANRGVYLAVQLNNKGKAKTVCIHRLVALAFIENLEQHPIVNHLDSNKHNNTIENLEWTTHSYNRRHSENSGTFTPKTLGVSQFSKTGEFITMFDSVKEAMISTGIRDSRICCVCKGNEKSAGGFTWKYTDFIYSSEPEPEGKEMSIYPRYVITRDGKVYSKSAKKFLSTRLNAGYEYVTLYNGETKKDFAIHNLVAQMFLDNTSNLPMVNHKNYDRTDNRVENLEWCTYSENMYHFGIKNRIPVLKLSKEGEVLKEYSSLTDAANDNNAHIAGIINVCKGRGKTSSGYRWRYKNNDTKTC